MLFRPDSLAWLAPLFCQLHSSAARPRQQGPPCLGLHNLTSERADRGGLHDHRLILQAVTPQLVCRDVVQRKVGELPSLECAGRYMPDHEPTN